MRQIWIPRIGVPEVLEVREAPDPPCGDDEVRVRVKFAGINFADLMARQGLYPDAPKLPAVVGYEVSGVVDQIGGRVSGFTLGDRVIAMTRFGGYSDVVCVPGAQLLKMPAAMTFEEGAALPVTYLTAHHMMLFTGTLRPGMRVLIHSAAGGVGVAAIQLARAHGCRIFGSASPGKHAFLRELGVEHPIDATLDVTRQVREILEREQAGGVDLVLDAVGGRSFTESYKLLGPAGRLVCFGVSAASTSNTRSIMSALSMLVSTKWWNPITLMNDNKTISGCNMGHLFDRPDLVQPQLVELLKMYERGQIKPHVDRTFPFAQAAQAHQWLHDRKARGKVLLAA